MQLIKRKGLTLVELLVVLMIVCAVAGIATFGTKWTDGMGERTADRQQAAALGMLISQYKLHMDVYPSSLDDLTKKNIAGYGPYINQIPLDSYGAKFNYYLNPSLGFAVWSNGENGINDSGTGISGITGDDTGIVIGL